MICPLCGHKRNLPGADWCVWCLFDLAAIDRPTPHDRVEHSLMTEPVAALDRASRSRCRPTPTWGRRCGR